MHFFTTCGVCDPDACAAGMREVTSLISSLPPRDTKFNMSYFYYCIFYAKTNNGIINYKHYTVKYRCGDIFCRISLSIPDEYRDAYSV